jgi:AcrR family transcriptional regulator
MKKPVKIRQPKQKRSIELKKRILEAAIKLFSRKGYFHTSSEEISREAGASIGSFYSYFADKKQLFIEVMMYFHEMTVTGAENLKPSLGGREIIEELIGSLLKSHKRYPGFHRELSALHFIEPDIRKINEKLDGAITERYYQGLSLFPLGTLRVHDLRAASEVIYKSVDAVIHWIILSHPAPEVEKARIAELIDMVCAYLFGTG